MNIVDKVKDYIEEECLKPSSKYGYDPFPFHFTQVVKYAKKLARQMGADQEIVTIAAWLHDVGSIIHGRENHHLTGAKIAENKLKELGYPKEKIKLVKKCILNHRGSVNNERTSLEEKIIADADAMSNFDNIAGLFGAAQVCENKNQGEAIRSVREKLQRKWKKIHFKIAKDIIRPKYKAAMLLLK